ncbi:uncharacterized protein VNE69_03112 [Vairimorpha necatrix]|uniref:Uncharacterized protein n=1 Tax=Vairimorpha necatrix TaxID=6039 RepID=A0AAX4JAE8_9MICR
MLKNELEDLFISGKYKNVSNTILISELQQYLNNNPLYINEIKNFLRDNDSYLFHKYALCFKHNAGVKCAFGIEQDTSKVDLTTSHIKIFKTLKPVYKTNNKKEENKTKYNIRKNNKKEQIKRYKMKNKEKQENEEKIKNIRDKIKRG